MFVKRVAEGEPVFGPGWWGQEDLRSEAVEQPSGIGGGVVMEGFVSKEGKFALNPSMRQEASGGVVVTGAGVYELTSSGDLDVLKLIKDVR